MANLSESILWENGIYQLETTDPVEGGPGGISNLQARQLGNRTLWLKQQLEQSLFSNGYVEITSATTLGNAQVGKTILVSGEPGYTITLPLASAFQNKAFFVAHNESAAVWSLDRIYDIVATGADTINICGTTRIKAQLKPNGSFWLVAGTSGWYLIGNSPLKGVGSVSIFANPATNIKGWLYCLGQTVSRTTYYDLFTVIGTTFGAGDGSTTFRLPDFRGEFIRGWDDARGVDPGRVFGSSQDDQLELHGHPFMTSRGNNDTDENGGIALDSNGLLEAQQPHTGAVSATRSALIGGFGGTETRPRNIALLYAIKY